MKGAGELLPAPKRGLYDRGMSRHERQTAQQERVIAAIAALAGAGRELSVANVVEQAGIGRNTFYEYFDDLEHGLAAIDARVRGALNARIESALRLARTPLERMRALLGHGQRVFRRTVNLRGPHCARNLSRNTLQSSRGSEVISQPSSNVRSSRVARCPASPINCESLQLLELFDSVSRAHLGSARAPDDLQRILADLAIRLLR